MSYTRGSIAGTIIARTEPGVLRRMIFGTVAAGDVSVYDQASGTPDAGNLIWRKTNPAAGDINEFNFPAMRGLTIVCTAAIIHTAVHDNGKDRLG